MRKRASFHKFRGPGWPSPEELRPFFFAPPGKEWFYGSGNDGASLRVEGLHGTDHLEPQTGRVDVRLFMTGNPDYGVLFVYAKWDGRDKRKFEYCSKGDITRLQEWVHDLHGSLVPIGLFVPFADAWQAVKEFIETDGELPKSIEWIANKDLPPNTFPDP